MEYRRREEKGKKKGKKKKEKDDEEEEEVRCTSGKVIMSEAKFCSWEGSKSRAEFELSCTLESTKYFPLSARPRAPQIPNLPTSAEPWSTSYPALQELRCSLPKQDIFVFDIKAASSGTSITLSRNISEGGGGSGEGGGK
ncbi:Hypothetical predicted protein [Scomber scombrus]|uniref:Uncharacterized protein n=1 Tax=Scomber scombrus TaxID=13677 RepID=A0AAV1Q2F9_SCOSC